MDSSFQLKQLLSEDLSSLSAYYRDISGEQGSGVLVVNYYPSGEVAQMSASFLKPSQIKRYARQMGLPTLELDFEQHNQHPSNGSCPRHSTNKRCSKGRIARGRDTSSKSQHT